MAAVTQTLAFAPLSATRVSRRSASAFVGGACSLLLERPPAAVRAALARHTRPAAALLPWLHAVGAVRGGRCRDTSILPGSPSRKPPSLTLVVPAAPLAKRVVVVRAARASQVVRARCGGWGEGGGRLSAELP